MPSNLPDKETLTSPNNPRVRELVKLKKSAYRCQTGLFIIEGYREFKLALTSDVKIGEVYFCPEFFSHSDEYELLSLSAQRKARLFQVSEGVYSKIAFGNRQEGLVACASYPERSLGSLRLSPMPFLVVAQGIEKPGNLGAIIRTVDGAGIDGLIVADPHTDVYNPNVVRCSLGTLFTAAVVQASSQDIFDWLKAHNIRIVCAQPDASVRYTSIDWKLPSAIVLGSEEKGISSFWRDNADELASIPMKGKADSLNVSITCAVIVFEALRQRNR